MREIVHYLFGMVALFNLCTLVYCLFGWPGVGSPAGAIVSVAIAIALAVWGWLRTRSLPPNGGTNQQHGRISEKLVIAWVTKLDLLLSMDAPILMAAHQLARDPDLGQLKAVTNDICNLLQSGWTLAEALEKHTETFGSLHLYVAAAEHTGTVGTALQRIATAYSQLYSMSIPTSVSYAPGNDNSISIYDASDIAVDTPTMKQANSLFMLLMEGEYSTFECYLVVEQKALNGQDNSCVAYAVINGVTKNIMNMIWQEGTHLLNRILLMANMNYWDRNQRSGWTHLKMGKAEATFVISREHGESGEMKITIRKKPGKSAEGMNTTAVNISEASHA